MSLRECSKKITSSAKFIDYFVHDILDYTLLNKEEKNFTKDISLFNIREAVAEIIGIQEDKSKMKNKENIVIPIYLMLMSAS